MNHITVAPGAPIAFRVIFNDGTSLSTDEIVRLDLYTNRVLNRLWFDESKTTAQPIEVIRAADGKSLDVSVTGENAVVFAEGYLKIILSVYNKTGGALKRRYEKTVLEIGTYYAGSTWDVESNDNILIEEIPAPTPTPETIPARVYPCDLQIVPNESGLIKVRLAGIPDDADLSRFTVRLMRLTKNATSKRNNSEGARESRFRETNPQHGSPAGIGGGSELYRCIPLLLNEPNTATLSYPFYQIETEGNSSFIARVLIGSKFSLTNNKESNLVLYQYNYVMGWNILPSWLVNVLQRIPIANNPCLLRVRSGKRYILDNFNANRTNFTIRDLGFSLFDGETKVSETKRFDLLCNVLVDGTLTNEQFCRGTSHVYPRIY